MFDITLLPLILSQITIVPEMIFIKLQIFASLACLKYQIPSKTCPNHCITALKIVKYRNIVRLSTFTLIDNTSIMCRSNCSAPIPLGQPLSLTKNVCDKKGRGKGNWSEKRAGHWKMKGLKWLNRAGQDRNKEIRTQGQPPQKVMSLGGWGQNN